MAYTSFGEFLRILRIKNHEVMGDLEVVRNVKVPFLSAVENGKKMFLMSGLIKLYLITI